MLTATIFMLQRWTLVTSFVPVHLRTATTATARTNFYSLYRQGFHDSFPAIGMTTKGHNDDINGSVDSFSDIDMSNTDEDIGNDSIDKSIIKNRRNDPLPVHTALQSPAGLLCDIEDDTTHRLPHRGGGQSRKRVLVLCTGGTLVRTTFLLSSHL
jgi:hypothetical protein